LRLRTSAAFAKIRNAKEKFINIKVNHTKVKNKNTSGSQKSQELKWYSVKYNTVFRETVPFLIDSLVACQKIREVPWCPTPSISLR
jgi:hypothetical protein